MQASEVVILRNRSHVTGVNMNGSLKWELVLLCMLMALSIGVVLGEKDAAYSPSIDKANFVKAIDNPYFPLKPGTKFVYEGVRSEGKEHNEVQVTNETKEIIGVNCVVVRDNVTLNGKLIEKTLDWYAQDKNGNVWYFGEDAKEYENGTIIGTKGSWEAGVDGAKPGIVMEAKPQVGNTYRQEYYKGAAEDMAEVLSLNESVSVPYGSFKKCLMTKEWTGLDPGVVENKYYATGIGPIMTAMVEGGSERTELVNFNAGAGLS